MNLLAKKRLKGGEVNVKMKVINVY